LAITVASPGHHLVVNQDGRQDERQGDDAEGKGEGGLHHDRCSIAASYRCQHREA
jgi:hypothetical protein